MAINQQLLALLSPEQRSALLSRVRARHHQGSEPLRRESGAHDPLPRVIPMGDARFMPFPLTDIQQAYWVGRQSAFSLGNVGAHGYLEVDCRDLDLPRLETAFNRLILRHDMLRAVVNADGYQQILREVPRYCFKRENLQEATPEAQDESLAAIRKKLSHQVLDTSVWPLFDIRASLLPDSVIRLHLSIDVLIFDAMSFDILSGELRHYYAGGEELPALTMSYADYVHGLALLKETSVFHESLAYWRRKIKDLAPPPSFPLAVAPESISLPEFRRLSGRMDKHRWDRIKQYAQRLGVTPSAALLTCYAAAIAQWSNGKRFTLNLTLFNRLPFHPEVNSLVGDFTSLIFIEIDYNDPIPFAERAIAVQKQLWLDLDHRHVSGVQVLREMTDLKRDVSAAQMPVVFTSAIKHASGESSPAAMKWLGDIHYTITQTPQVWLDHQVVEDEGALEYDWDAVHNLFPAGLLESMFECYQQSLESLAESEQVWRQELLCAIPPDQLRLFALSNSTSAAIPKGLLHEPFIRQALAEPRRIAVIDAEKSLTYEELYLASNSLACRLWKAGIDTGELIGVLLPKSRWQVVAVLGILEAGAMYLPIETSLGDDRVAQLIELSGIRRLVTQGHVLAGRRLPESMEVLLVDDSNAAGHVVRSLPVMRSPSNLAYVIYTSGSTGIPKGVMIDHRGALNTCVDVNQRFAVCPDDRVLALSALNFDLSVYDIFGPLSVGGALVIPHHDKLREPAHWDEMASHHRVTLWNTVPALMDIYTTYLAEVAHRQNSELRIVMLSGDWIPLPLPAAVSKTCPNAATISLGGATEASIWSVIYPIGDVAPEWRSIPYGRAMLNQSMHVFDAHLRPCPVWMPGELFIGGVGVARGYWRDPERTAAQFITHPQTGERLYRTGDLGRWLPCGNIEFLGRTDFQVKINGYRVELGEVETNMSRFPGVKAAVCSVAGDSRHSRQLVGYFVRGSASPTPAKKTKDNEKLKLRLSEPAVRRFNDEIESFDLPEPHDLTESDYRRHSQRLFPPKPVQLSQLGGLLGTLLRSPFSTIPKYRYGSAGSLYPVQTYLYAVPGRVEGLPGGTYYYHPVENRLVRLSAWATIDSSYYGGWNADMISTAAFHIVLIADLDAIEPFYGADSMHLCRIESGLMAQVLEENALLHGIGICQLGGFDFERAQPHFQLEHRSAYLHALVGGIELDDAGIAQLAEARAKEKASDEAFQSRLLDYLRKKLPDYMVPTVLIQIPELPLSPNGKVDRKALPLPRREPTLPPRMEEKTVSMTGLAELISNVWREVLAVDAVGVNDNFFDLGGTSFEMIKIHTKLSPILPREVPLVDMFFVYPTIAALVESLQSHPNDSPRSRTRNRATRNDSRQKRKSPE